MKKPHLLLLLLFAASRLAAQTAPLSFLFENVNGTPAYVAVAPSLELPLVAVAFEKANACNFLPPTDNDSAPLPTPPTATPLVTSVGRPTAGG